MSESVIAFTARTFPDSAQTITAGAAAVAVNQSRVTFSGGRGRVRVSWSFDLFVPVGPTVTDPIVVVGGSAIRLLDRNFRADQVTGAGLALSGFVEAYLDSPSVNSYVELFASCATANMQFLASSSALLVETYPEPVQAGPVAQVA